MVGLERYPCCRLNLLNYMGCIVVGLMYVGVSVWLGWSGISVAG